MTFIQKAAKAFVGATIAAIGGLVIVITGAEGFADVTTNEWLVVAAQTLGVFAGVYFPTNKTTITPTV